MSLQHQCNVLYKEGKRCLQAHHPDPALTKLVPCIKAAVFCFPATLSIAFPILERANLYLPRADPAV